MTKDTKLNKIRIRTQMRNNYRQRQREFMEQLLSNVSEILDNMDKFLEKI